MARKKTEKKLTAPKNQTSRKFKGIIVFFISFALILFLFILYYSFSRTVIYITPEVTPREENFNITVAEDLSEEIDLNENIIKGLILEKESADFLVIDDLGPAQEVPAQAEGKVTIYNNWSQVQPLAATTRLLSEEGVLFRTKERVDVPAKNSIEVEVYADEEGAKGNIGPTKFTIPGLSSQMQELVWGESSQAMTGGTKQVNQITQSLVLEHQNKLAEQIKQNALEELIDEAKAVNENYSLSPDRIEYEVLERKVEPPLGSEAELFTLSLNLKLIAVAFSENDLQTIAQRKLEENLESGFAVSSDNFELNYTLENFNLKDKKADFKVQVQGESLIKLSNPIFNRKNLTNKDRQQITAYLLDFEGIKDVEVKFSPFWVFRAPKLEDHIEIRLK